MIGLFLLSASPLYADSEKLAFKNPFKKKESYSKKWFYTLQEMETVYMREYFEGKRLNHHARSRQGRYFVTYEKTKYDIPSDFIRFTLRHLEEMLQKGYAKYIFRLDAFHSHLFVPDSAFRENYEHLNQSDIIRVLVKDDQLGALYHNAEHLALHNPPLTGKIDPAARELIRKRNVIGWFDGRPLELTYPAPESSPGRIKANTASVPEGHSPLWLLFFKATRNGEFEIRHKNQTIRIDISFHETEYH